MKKTKRFVRMCLSPLAATQSGARGRRVPLRTSLFFRISIICVFLLGVSVVSWVSREESPGVLADSPSSANDRIPVPSPAANQPIPLPIRAKPVTDRASLDDPTLGASNASATAASIPPRTRKAPFLKLSLPDPYDHRRTAVPEPEESMDFPLGNPHAVR